MKIFPKKLWIICLAILLCSYSLLVRADENPVTMLENTANQMIAALKQNKATLKNKPSLVYSIAQRIVVPHADLDEMSMRVLPPQIWNKATTGQRSLFKQEFTQLLVRTYASALADYSDQTVQFYPVRGGYQGKKTIMVNSKIVRSDGPSIPVNYRLTQKGTSWRLFDMSVEGISLLESFRSQFADKLSQGNIDKLIKDLKAHNRRGG
jgi:phospholipid transport system substrate-binding protein